jgi:hypothetical protein
MDDENALMLLVQVLVRFGHEVQSARMGLKRSICCGSTIVEPSLDLVLLDLTVVSRMGEETARSLKELILPLETIASSGYRMRRSCPTSATMVSTTCCRSPGGCPARRGDSESPATTRRADPRQTGRQATPPREPPRWTSPESELEGVLTSDHAASADGVTIGRHRMEYTHRIGHCQPRQGGDRRALSCRARGQRPVGELSRSWVPRTPTAK